MPAETVEQMFSMLPMKSVSQGTSTTLVAAFDPKLKSQSSLLLPLLIQPTNRATDASCLYMSDCQPAEAMDFAVNGGLSAKLGS